VPATARKARASRKPEGARRRRPRRRAPRRSAGCAMQRRAAAAQRSRRARRDRTILCRRMRKRRRDQALRRPPKATSGPTPAIHGHRHSGEEHDVRDELVHPWERAQAPQRNQHGRRGEAPPEDLARRQGEKDERERDERSCGKTRGIVRGQQPVQQFDEGAGDDVDPRRLFDERFAREGSYDQSRVLRWSRTIPKVYASSGFHGSWPITPNRIHADASKTTHRTAGIPATGERKRPRARRRRWMADIVSAGDCATACGLQCGVPIVA